MTEEELIEFRASATSSVTLAVSVWWAPSDRYVIALLRNEDPDLIPHELLFTRCVADSITDSFRAQVHATAANGIWKAVSRIAVSPTLERVEGCDGATSTLTVESGQNHTEYQWWSLPAGWERVGEVEQKLHHLAEKMSKQVRGRGALEESSLDLMRRLSTEEELD
jgi:hypothetical protein